MHRALGLRGACPLRGARIVRFLSTYYPSPSGQLDNMAKGVTVTSSIITISGSTAEAAPGVMVQEEIPLSLDLLSREVLLIYAVDVNVNAPDAQATVNSSVGCSLSTTSRTTLGNINNTNVFARGTKQIRAGGFVDGGVAFTEHAPETPTSNALDFIAICPTNDLFVQIQGTNNLAAKSANWRIWCARAKVTADIFAALVTSEQLSA